MGTAKTQTLPRLTAGDRVIRFIFWYRRLERILFPSPAETRFVQVMRGRAWQVKWIKHSRTGFPLTFLWRGRLLKNELVDREVWADDRRRYCLDFATPRASYRKAVEIDGMNWHQDIVREQQRDEALNAMGWQVLHVPARKVFREPRIVYMDVLKFLKS